MEPVTIEFIERKYDFVDLTDYMSHFMIISQDMKVSVFITFNKNTETLNTDPSKYWIKYFIYGRSKDISFIIFPFEWKCCLTVYILQKNKLIKEFDIIKKEIRDFINKIKEDLNKFENHYIKLYLIQYEYKLEGPMRNNFRRTASGIVSWLKHECFY